MADTTHNSRSLLFLAVFILCFNLVCSTSFDSDEIFFFHEVVRPVGSKTLLANSRFTADNSFTNGNKVVKVIRVAQKGGTAIQNLPSNDNYQREFDQVETFYFQNSGGKLKLKFEFHSEFIQEPSYTKINCDNKECPVDVPYFPELTNLGSRFHYLIILEDYCPCLKFRGLGQILQRISWSNGSPEYKIVAHELGHNFGASHANIRQQEYANSYSIMGAGKQDLSSHISVAGKTQFKWLSMRRQIVTLARKGKCGLLFKDTQKHCRDSCTETSPCTYRLHAHDVDNGYDRKVYGIKIGTDNPQVSVWLEYRHKFESLRHGLLSVWSYERSFDDDFVSNYGPTQVMLTRLSEENLFDLSHAVIREKDTWVYDLDHTGFVVTVNKVDPEAGFVDLSAYFEANTASEFSYTTKGLLMSTNSQAAAVGLLCGTPETINLSRQHPHEFFHFKLSEETDLTIMLQTSCDIDKTLSPLSGIYLYTTYPLQHELNQEFDPRRGAFSFLPFKCSARGQTYSSSLGSGFVKHSVDFSAQVSRSRDPDVFPAYIDFSTDNYALFYLAEESVSVEVDLFLVPNRGCRAACTEVIVDTSLDFADTYTLVDQSRFRSSNGNFELLRTNEDFWVLKQRAGIELAVELLDATSVGATYPQDVARWSQSMTVACVSNIEFQVNSPNTSRAFLIQASAYIIIVTILLTVVILLAVRVGKHHTESNKKRRLLRKQHRTTVADKTLMTKIESLLLKIKSLLAGFLLKPLQRSTSLERPLMQMPSFRRNLSTNRVDPSSLTGIKRGKKQRRKAKYYKVYRLETRSLDNVFQISLRNYGGAFLDVQQCYSSPTNGWSIVAILCLEDGKTLDNLPLINLKLRRSTAKTLVSTFVQAVNKLLTVAKEHQGSRVGIAGNSGHVNCHNVSKIKVLAYSESKVTFLSPMEFIDASTQGLSFVSPSADSDSVFASLATADTLTDFLARSKKLGLKSLKL